MAHTRRRALISSTTVQESLEFTVDMAEGDHLAGVLAPATHSPLWMVTSEPSLTQFVADLQHLRLDIMRTPQVNREVRFSRAGLEEVRTAFAHMIRHGEEVLHRLSQLLCATLLTSVQLQSVVIGEVETTKERFTLTQALTMADLYSTLDIDLGSRQLRKLQFFDGHDWSKATLVANVVDYQPTEPNRYGIHRITTRIKAEEEIWNKVVDEIFDLDALVFRDKQLRHLSRYVKDIFGIKVVVGEVDDIAGVQQVLLELEWCDTLLSRHHIEPGATTRQLEFVEVKDYLTPGHSKRSGWEAMKSVIRWSGKTIEIQVQPLRTFLHERELLTQESHVSFKAQREQVRNRVAEQVPLFRFYRDLLHWLFREPTSTPPQHPGITVFLVD